MLSAKVGKENCSRDSSRLGNDQRNAQTIMGSYEIQYCKHAWGTESNLQAWNSDPNATGSGTWTKEEIEQSIDLRVGDIPSDETYTDEQYMQRIAEQVQKLMTAKEIKDDSPKDNLLSEKAVGGRNQDGSGRTKSEDFFSVSGFRTHVVATAVCATGGVHPHSVSLAHSDTLSLRRVQTSRTRMAQGVCSAHVTSLHLTLSILMFHSPSLLFPDGHFETTFPTLTSAPSLPNCSRSESAGQAHFLWVL